MSFKIIGSGSEIPSKKISNAYISKKTKKEKPGSMTKLVFLPDILLIKIKENLHLL